MLILNKYIFLQMTAVNTSQFILLRKTFRVPRQIYYIYYIARTSANEGER